MISRFKFLTDNDTDELEYGGFVHDLHDGFASWMWARQENINRDPNWLVDHMDVMSIRTFLSMFPEQMIVPILSITGNEITMTMNNVNDEWPFSLNGETPLYITFLRWVPEI